MAWEDLDNPLLTPDEKLNEALNAGIANQAQVDDALQQRDYFEANRPQIESDYGGRLVAAINQTLLVGDDWATLEYQARLAYPNNIYYIEAVQPYNHVLVGSPVG